MKLYSVITRIMHEIIILKCRFNFVLHSYDGDDDDNDDTAKEYRMSEYIL